MENDFILSKLSETVDLIDDFIRKVYWGNGELTPDDWCILLDQVGYIRADIKDKQETLKSGSVDIL